MIVLLPQSPFGSDSLKFRCPTAIPGHLSWSQWIRCLHIKNPKSSKAAIVQAQEEKIELIK